jgi:hypothetical protein
LSAPQDVGICRAFSTHGYSALAGGQIGGQIGRQIGRGSVASIDALLLIATSTVETLRRHRGRRLLERHLGIVRSAASALTSLIPGTVRGPALKQHRPLLNKLRVFLLRKTVRAIVGANTSTLDVEGCINGGRVLLARLSKGVLGFCARKVYFLDLARPEFGMSPLTMRASMEVIGDCVVEGLRDINDEGAIMAASDRYLRSATYGALLLANAERRAPSWYELYQQLWPPATRTAPSRQPSKDSHSTATTRASGASLCRRTVASASAAPSASATSTCAVCSESNSAWNQRAPHARSTTSSSGSGRSWPRRASFALRVPAFACLVTEPACTSVGSTCTGSSA